MKSELKAACRVELFGAIPCFNFDRLNMNYFSKPKAVQLKGFIAVRLTSDLKDLKKQVRLMPEKFQTKGQLKKQSQAKLT